MNQKTISHCADQLLQPAFAGRPDSTDLESFPTPLLSCFLLLLSRLEKIKKKILSLASFAKRGDPWDMVVPKWKSAEIVSQKISLSKLTETNLVGTGLPLLILAANEQKPRVLVIIL